MAVVRVFEVFIRVKDVLDLLAAGATRDEILADYPYLEAEDIAAVLEFAAKQNDHPVLRSARLRFLVDAQLPPALARFIESRGQKAEHVADLALETAPGSRVRASLVATSITYAMRSRSKEPKRILARQSCRVEWRYCQTRALRRDQYSVAASLTSGQPVVSCAMSTAVRLLSS